MKTIFSGFDWLKIAPASVATWTGSGWFCCLLQRLKATLMLRMGMAWNFRGIKNTFADWLLYGVIDLPSWLVIINTQNDGWLETFFFVDCWGPVIYRWILGDEDPLKRRMKNESRSRKKEKNHFGVETRRFWWLTQKIMYRISKFYKL